MFELRAPAEPFAQDTVIRAWLELDLRDRQLAVLRLSFPQWVISYAITQAGWSWRAVPSWQLTVEMVAAGVRPVLERGNPVQLMADLSLQMGIIHGLARRRRHQDHGAAS